MNPGITFRQLVVAVFVFFYVPLAYYYGWALPPQVGIDFPSWFHAAHFAFAEGKSPYGLDTFKGLQGFFNIKVQPYLYPPPSLLLFWPLSKLTFAHSRLLFILVSHACFLACVWLTVARLTPLPSDRRLRELTVLIAMAYVIIMNGSADTLGSGQVNFMAEVCICLALVGIKNRASDWRIGLPLSIAILIKTLPVLLLLPLLARRRFRAAGLTCAFFAGLSGIAALMLPTGVWRQWLFDIAPIGGYANDKIPAAFCWNQSINAFGMRLFKENYFSKAPLLYPPIAKPFIMVLVLLVVATTIYFSFRAVSRAKDTLVEGDDIAAYLLMIYMIAPLSWDHHLIYVQPALVLTISLLVSGSVRGKRALLLTGCLMLVAWRFPVDRWDLIFGWRTLLLSAKLYPIAILWFFYIRRLRHGAALAAPVRSTEEHWQASLSPDVVGSPVQG